MPRCNSDAPLLSGNFGVEVCAYCSGRYALFGGHSRLLPPSAPSGCQAANLVEGRGPLGSRGLISSDIGSYLSGVEPAPQRTEPLSLLAESVTLPAKLPSDRFAWPDARESSMQPSPRAPEAPPP